MSCFVDDLRLLPACAASLPQLRIRCALPYVVPLAYGNDNLLPVDWLSVGETPNQHDPALSIIAKLVSPPLRTRRKPRLTAA